MGCGRAYLDHNASAPMRPVARESLIAWLGQGGNPSSVHQEGRAARRRVEQARQAIARFAGAPADGVTFVSGGTEANVTALCPRLTVDGERHDFQTLLVAATEHPSVLSGGRFASERIVAVAVDANGVIELEALDKMLRTCAGPVLVSVMTANNETGVVQPIGEIAALVHAAGGVLHTDAVQALGRLAVDMSGWGVDMMSISAHKIGGPVGVGALLLREGLGLAPLLSGGGQEFHRRAGTENVGGIVAFAAVAEELVDFEGEITRIRRLRDWFEDQLLHICGETVVVGQSVERLANTSCFTVPGLRAETAMIAFDLDGIAVSSGSACSSGKVASSHVLKAMGYGDSAAGGAIRVSLGWSTTEEDISRLLRSFAGICENQRLSRRTEAA